MHAIDPNQPPPRVERASGPRLKPARSRATPLRT